jgi:Tubulin-tyrosine ligase family
LGFDVLIDSKCKPYLLEVNASPSFGTDSALDYKIKKNVIADAFQLLNFSYKTRMQLIKDLKEKTKDRILTGKINKISSEDKDKLKQQKLEERFKFESTRTRGYELIYPSANKDKNLLYNKLIEKSNEIWDDFTTGKRKQAQIKKSNARSQVGLIETKKPPATNLNNHKPKSTTTQNLYLKR